MHRKCRVTSSRFCALSLVWLLLTSPCFLSLLLPPWSRSCPQTCDPSISSPRMLWSMRGSKDCLPLLEVKSRAHTHARYTLYQQSSSPLPLSVVRTSGLSPNPQSCAQQARKTNHLIVYLVCNSFINSSTAY